MNLPPSRLAQADPPVSAQTGVTTPAGGAAETRFSRVSASCPHPEWRSFGRTRDPVGVFKILCFIYHIHAECRKEFQRIVRLAFIINGEHQLEAAREVD